MKRIKSGDLSSCKGQFLARDIYYHGKLIFKSNSIIDQSLVDRVNEINDNMYIFVYRTMQEQENMENILTKEIFSLVSREMNLIFARYSFTITEDKTLMRSIVDFFLEDILRENYFRNYLENLFIINFNLFNHVLRVTIISLLVSIKANLNKELIRGIAVGALLHEIGKIRLFIEFPLLGDKEHKYNIEEKLLVQTAPIIGYEEVLNNDLVPLISKKIILFQYVWDNFDASYDPVERVHKSYPLYYENNQLTKDMKDISINIVQAVHYFDCYFNGPSIESDKRGLTLSERAETLQFVRDNSGVIFSRTAADLLLNCISLFAIGDLVMLSDKRTALVKKHTNNVDKPIVEIQDETHEEINLNENPNLTIIELLKDGSDVNNDNSTEE